MELGDSQILHARDALGNKAFWQFGCVYLKMFTGKTVHLHFVSE